MIRSIAPTLSREGIKPVARYVEHAMGIPISLALRGRHTRDAAAQTAWAMAMSALHEADHIFSTYRFDSHVSRINRGEITIDECPPEVAEVVALGAAAEGDSNGAFSIWLPDANGRRMLDPSGVVKGWAAERAASTLRQLEGTDFCLSAGGDIVCRTLDMATGPWRIGVEDPADPDRVVAVVPVYNGAVATSGTSHRGQHLLDARTGQPPSGITSVTVVAKSLTHADIDATAAYAQGQDAARWLRTRPGRTGFITWADSRITVISLEHC